MLDGGRGRQKTGIRHLLGKRPVKKNGEGAEELSDCDAGLTPSEGEMGGSKVGWRHLLMSVHF